MNREKPTLNKSAFRLYTIEGDLSSTIARSLVRCCVGSVGVIGCNAWEAILFKLHSERRGASLREASFSFHSPFFQDERQGSTTVTHLHKKKVLLVDDDSEISMLLTLALQGKPEWEVEAVPSGEEALAKVPGWRPDLVLLDLKMPGMDGLATLKALRELEEGRELAVIVLSGVEEEEELAKLRRYGVLGVLSKPFALATVAQSIEAIWTTE